MARLRSLRSAQPSALDIAPPVDALPEGTPLKLIDFQKLATITMQYWISLMKTRPDYLANPEGYVLKFLEKHFEAKAREAVRQQHSRAGRKYLPY